jgi:SAM-dependent methyltransferase
MSEITHQKQQEIWEAEHQNPRVLQQMDSIDASGGVIKFLQWLKANSKKEGLRGIEMGCGKGRNVIAMAKEGYYMTGFDFSKFAINAAKNKAKKAGLLGRANFARQDATKHWAFPPSYFDFGIDCFASTDIESPEGRAFARDELIRVIKPNGYLLVYTLSTADEFHKEMVNKFPSSEKNAFLHPTTGKFEKTFDEEELLSFYKGLKLVEAQRMSKKTIFFGKEYDCKHFWLIFQKPGSA